MKVVLEAQVEPGKENLTPEYHFIGGDAQGWNTEKVMILTPGKIHHLHPEMKERLAYEGIKIIEEADETTIVQVRTKEQLKEHFAIQFERPVKEIMGEISSEERETFQKVFGHRFFTLDSSGKILDANLLYDPLNV